jgi:DNA-binding NarL/FixJ family response regulator
MCVRVVLADAYAIVRQGLRLILVGAGFEVVGEASDGHEAVRLARMLEPDVAVLDLVMPLLNGLDAGREIHGASPGTKVVLLTGKHDEQVVLEALQAGIRACVLKTYKAEGLIRAIQDVVAGGVYLSPGMSRSLVDAFCARTAIPVDPLSGRERQVLQLIAEGKRSREIADLLGVSVKTAESHRTHITKKLGISQTAGLVRYALQHGLTQLYY